MKLSDASAKSSVHLGLAPRAAHARLRVGDEVLEVDDAALDERQEAELHRGRIAARVGDEARALRIALAIDLGQAVHRLARRARAQACFILYHFSHSATSLRRKSAERSTIRAPPSSSARACAHRDAVRRGEEHARRTPRARRRAAR